MGLFRNRNWTKAQNLQWPRHVDHFPLVSKWSNGVNDGVLFVLRAREKFPVKEIWREATLKIDWYWAIKRQREMPLYRTVTGSFRPRFFVRIFAIFGWNDVVISRFSIRFLFSKPHKNDGKVLFGKELMPFLVWQWRYSKIRFAACD